MNELKNILADMETVFAESGFPGEFLDEWDQMECLASHTGRETFLVQRKDDGEAAVATCYDLSVFPIRPDIRLLKELDHPGLPHYYGEYRNDRMLVIVREYIDGEPLSAYVKERELSEAEIIAFAEQLCDILDVLHSHTPPVIHRDIKPENIIVKPDGGIVLIDFDIARTLKGGGGDGYGLLRNQGICAPGAVRLRADGYPGGYLCFRSAAQVDGDRKREGKQEDQHESGPAEGYRPVHGV